MKELLKKIGTVGHGFTGRLTAQFAPQPEVAVLERGEKYPKVVEEIHKEFFTAADQLLAEANKTLEEQNHLSIQKGLDLKSLGFSAAKEVTEAVEAGKVREEAKHKAQLISDYQRKYPLNRFITEDRVNHICNKYGLVWGTVDMYTGFVPAANLAQIKNFKKPDYIDVKHHVVGKITKVEFNYATSTKAQREVTEFLASINGTHEQFAGSHPEIYLRSLLREKGLEEAARGVNYARAEACTTHDQFTICAPRKDMNLEGKFIAGNKVATRNVLHTSVAAPDPIVLYPIKGGYLIVTAWGDEASDPEVVNAINN